MESTLKMFIETIARTIITTTTMYTLATVPVKGAGLNLIGITLIVWTILPVVETLVDLIRNKQEESKIDYIEDEIMDLKKKKRGK